MKSIFSVNPLWVRPEECPRFDPHGRRDRWGDLGRVAPKQGEPAKRLARKLFSERLFAREVRRRLVARIAAG